MWFIGVEVEQETSAPPLKKNSWIRPCETGLWPFRNPCVIWHATNASPGLSREQSGYIQYRYLHILININSCFVTPSNDQQNLANYHNTQRTLFSQCCTQASLLIYTLQFDMHCIRGVQRHHATPLHSTGT